MSDVRMGWVDARAVSLAAVALGLSAAVASPTFAQEEPTELSGVTVTGEAQRRAASLKFTAPLVDTPQTVSVIPQAVFTQQGARDLTDVLRNTPGITFNAGENGFSTGLGNFSLRGFDTSGSVFTDGVRDSGSYSRDVFNLEQVEVVKGPAADNGRGSAGGYVNLVTKTPKAQPAYAASVSYGFDDYDSDSRVRATLDVNETLSAGAAVRLNLLAEGGGVAGRAKARNRTYGVAPSVAFGLDSATRVVLAYQHITQDDRPDWGVPAAIMDGMLRRDPTLNAGSLRDKSYGLASDFDRIKADVVLGRIEHALSPNVTISNQTRWSRTDHRAAFTVPTGYTAATRIVATQRQSYGRKNETLANNTNLLARVDLGGLTHAVSAGLELSREEASARSFPTPAAGNVGILNPDWSRPAPAFAAATQRSEVSVGTIAAYLYDTIELTPSWLISGGLRAERYSVEIANSTVAGAALGPNGYEEDRTSVNGKIGLIYKPSANGSIYASVGVSSLPPASFLSNSDISREGANAFPGLSEGINSKGVKLQRSINYELGAKWNLFSNRLSANAALFRTERRNVAITGVNPNVNPAPPVALLGYGEQIVQGLEIGAVGQITPDWSILGGVLWMDSEREHSAFLDAGRRRANPADYGAVLRTSGDQLAFTPRQTANLWTTYRVVGGLTVGLGVQHVGSSFAGRPDDAERIIPNGTFGKLPAYTVANALVEYQINPMAQLRLNIDNITDELYAVSTNWPAQRVLLGPPRSFLISLSLKR